MPIYRIKCDACGQSQDVFRTVATYDDLPDCCGQRMHRVICAPAVHADLPGYESPVTGKWIEGRSARREDLLRSGCRPWEGFEQERKEADKQTAEAWKRADATMERAVEQTAAQLGV